MLVLRQVWRQEFCRLLGFGDALGLAPDVGHRDRPEGDEIDAGHKLGKERRQKLPVPAEKEGQYAADAEIEQVIGGRRVAFDE